jgi:radical SAM superfamily enzyme YgiQ (UPF0313 family)
MSHKIFLADLTHTGSGISALTFPLGTSFVASYARKVLGSQFDFKLFKFPDHLARAVFEHLPLVLGFANYSWNLQLSYKLAEQAKKEFPHLVVVAGGPNFPTSEHEKSAFLTKRSAIDFYIEYEGEVGFVELLQKLAEYDFNVVKLKTNRERITNCSYMTESQLISGTMQRIADVNIIPSPYLNGDLDEFFALPLVPMIETTRGCPFSCSFCADGLVIKNKVKRYNSERTEEELHYIAERVENVDELIVTDLNFGMYKEDVNTAKYIADIQSKFAWPKLIDCPAGKNRPERIKEVASILKGSWIVGAAIQSTDDEVLANIQRSNISKDTYYELIKHMNSLDKGSMTYSDIILALPGDTKQKHFESLRYAVDSHVNSLRMHQAIMLSGTAMASSATREKYGLLTKFRIMHGGVGRYQFGEAQVPLAEIEEIIVGSNTMSMDDYVQCRVMNLFIETYFNNALCEEIFAALRAMNLSVFDFLVYLHRHEELYTPKMKEILASFVMHTKDDLYDSYEEAEKSALSVDLFNKYLTGELGINELMEHKALLYFELKDIVGVLIEAVKRHLEFKGLLNQKAVSYFDETGEFILAKKKEIQNTNLVTMRTFRHDFKAIEALHFQVDPRYVNETAQGVRLKFFHDAAQREHIQNAINLYRNHSSGISKVIQRGNIIKMFRRVEPA